VESEITLRFSSEVKIKTDAVDMVILSDKCSRIKVYLLQLVFTEVFSNPLM
jgi:hypothetical protein